MIYDVYRIGKAISGINDTGIEPLLMPDVPRNMTNVIWLGFTQKGDEICYTGVEITDYDVNNAEKYLLRKASSNGANFGPSAQLTEVDKTLIKKIAVWFKEASTEIDISDNGNIFSAIYDIIMEKREDIITEINEQMPKGKNIKNIITVKLNGQYPLKTEQFFQYYSKKVMKKIIGEENHIGTCCLCGKKNVNLLPKVDVFKFYTIDKPGFISGGFSEEDIWRNCPVCISCEPILREGKKYMLDHLRFRFFGFTYFLIPSSTCNEDTQEYLVDQLENISHKSFSLNEAADNEFTSLSGDMFEELSQSSDINTYRILFFKKENSAERIVLDMKDVFPSKFAVLYSAKHLVEGIYEELTNEKFSFSYFRRFLSKSDPVSKTYDLDGNFLALTQAIFMKNKVSMDTLLPHYMRTIRRAFLNSEYFDHTTLRAWIGIKYLYEIGCVDYGKEDNYMSEILERILEPYDIGLNTPIKKALVLVGALVQEVINIQYEELNHSTPFITKLKGLKMISADVQGLVKEAVFKMMEYKKYFKESKLIVETITDLVFKSSPVWKLSVDELNFYIVGGMALHEKIYDGLRRNKVCQQQNEVK